MTTVTLKWKGQDEFSLNETASLGELSPKELMLYAMGLCLGKTIVALLLKMRLDISGLTLGVNGELSDSLPAAASSYTSFFQSLHIEAPDNSNDHKIAHAVAIAHDKYCGVTLMMDRIAPVGIELFINGKKQELQS